MTVVSIDPILRLALSAYQAEKVQDTATMSEIISPIWFISSVKKLANLLILALLAHAL